MLAYRSAEEAARLRAEELEAEIARAREEAVDLEIEIDRAHAEALDLSRRLAEVGPGGGAADAERDRVGLAAMLLALTGFPLLALHFEWHQALRAQPWVMPAVLLLGVPGALAAVVAAPFRRETPGCRAGFLLGLGFAGFAVLHALLGVIA